MRNSNCCFLKFDIKPQNELQPATPGQASVTYLKEDASFPGRPGVQSSNGFDLIGAYDSPGDNIGSSYTWDRQTVGDCLWDCSQRSGCVGALYYHDSGNNNAGRCLLKSKIANPAIRWSGGYSGFLYSKPDIAAAIRTPDHTYIARAVPSIPPSSISSASPGLSQGGLVKSSNCVYGLQLKYDGSLELTRLGPDGNPSSSWNIAPSQRGAAGPSQPSVWTIRVSAEGGLQTYGIYNYVGGRVVERTSVEWCSGDGCFTGRFWGLGAAAPSGSSGPYSLVVEDDGNVALVDSRRQVYWESMTANKL